LIEENSSEELVPE